MPAVERTKPRDIFSAEHCQELASISQWQGIASVAHAWLVIAATLTACTIWVHPLLWLLALPIVGGRQLGLAILMHDAAHGLLHPDRRVNDFLGRWLCGLPVGATLEAYRSDHFQHHKFTQQAEDPDLVLSAPFPVQSSSLRRKFVRDLTGQTFFRQRLSFAAGPLGKVKGRTENETLEARRASRQFWIGHAVVGIALALLGWGVAFLIWFAALATWFQLAIRVRNIAEHACTNTGPDPFTHARTTHAGFLERALVAPYWVNYHAEHHLFTWIPCYRLPRAHALLKDGGFLAKMTIAPGYRSVLRLVTRDESGLGK